MYWTHRLVCDSAEPHVVVVAEVFYSQGEPAFYAKASAVFDETTDEDSASVSIASQLGSMMESTRLPILFFPDDFVGTVEGLE